MSYQTKILVSFYLTDTHRFTTDDYYLEFYLTAENGDYLQCENEDFIMTDFSA